MINKKKILYIAFALGAVLCIELAVKCYNAYTVDEDTAPLVFAGWTDDKLQFYYLQNRELIEKPVGFDVHSNYARYEINKEKREEILLQLWDEASIPVKYNYKTDQMEALGDNKVWKELVSPYDKKTNTALYQTATISVLPFMIKFMYMSMNKNAIKKYINLIMIIVVTLVFLMNGKTVRKCICSKREISFYIT